MYAAVIVLLVFSNKLIQQMVLERMQPPATQLSKNSIYECGILLGGMGTYDKSGKGFFNINADRFITTVKLYQQHHIKRILISGGNSKILGKANYNEAAFIKEQLLQTGVKEQDILIEGKARNTHENAVFSKQLLDSLHINGPYVLITSATHMYRSRKVFEKAGFSNIIPYPCSYKVYNEKSFLDYIIPNAEVLYFWDSILKEAVGVLMYKLTGKA